MQDQWVTLRGRHRRRLLLAWAASAAAQPAAPVDESSPLHGQGADPQRAIALLCGEADYRLPPRAPRPTSGLVEQQRWFRRAAARRD